MWLECACACLTGLVCSRNTRLRSIWIVTAAAFVAAELSEEADAAAAAGALAAAEANRRRQWWTISLLKRAPVLSGGDRSYRGRRRFGAAEVGVSTPAAKWT